MDLSFAIGITAGTICTLSFLPQVIVLYRTKDAGSISLVTFSLFAVGITLWLVYGIMIKDIPVIVANIVTLVLILLIVAMKIRYR